MKQEVMHHKYGKIVYEESSLSGNKNIYFNDVQLKKVSKTTFEAVIDDEELVVYVKGNTFTGLSLKINGELIEIIPQTKWYEYVMCLIPFILVMIWGNVIALCQIIPVVGGAIGGAISGLCSILSLFFAKKTNNVLFKVLIFIAATAIAFGICALLGVAFVELISNTVR